MFPKLFDLPLGDFPYLVEVCMKPIPSSCIWIVHGTPSLRLQMEIEVFPQPNNLITAGEVWYGLLRTMPIPFDTVTRRCALV